MLFQWYLFVFLILMFQIAKMGHQFYPVHVAGEYEPRCRWATALIVTAVLTYVAATRHLSFIDTRSYYNHYMREAGTWESIVKIFNGSGKDKGFYIFTAILKAIIGPNEKIYFAIIAGIPLLCLASTYRRYSCNFFMTIFLFLVSGEYVQWSHNGIRQFMAVGMTFVAAPLLLKKRFIPYFLVVLFASIFHATALIMIPVSLVVHGRPWNAKMVLFTLAVMVAASSLDELMGAITTLMENTQYAGDVDSLLATEGTNPLRVLVYAIPPLMALVFRKRLTQYDVPIINMAVNMSVISMGAYVVSMFTSGIFIARVPIYFSLYNYILLPWIIQRVFDRSSARVIYFLLIGCYMAFYYYQMHIVWGAVTAL